MADLNKPPGNEFKKDISYASELEKAVQETHDL